MKSILSFLLLSLLPLFAFSQANIIYKNAEKTNISNFLKLESTALTENRIRILLHFDYGEKVLKNRSDAFLLGVGEIEKVTLYCSDFPKTKTFTELNTQRLKQLSDFINFEEPNEIKWSIVKQTDCKNKQEAQELFHGFEIILRYPESMKVTSMRVDTSFKDFVVQEVLERNNWTEMLIVSDLTGSMHPYTSQLLLWLKLNTMDDRIKQFLFFNDGNTTPDLEKVIGNTGGLFHSRSKEYAEIERIASQCMLSGTGSDLAENDIEALLAGMKLCPDCKENILIADNFAPIRDYALLKKINKPVRVIICGGSEGVNIEYLNLARQTGGSVHLLEEDILNLMKLNEGETLKIGASEYIITDNQFVLVKRT